MGGWNVSQLMKKRRVEHLYNSRCPSKFLKLLSKNISLVMNITGGTDALQIICNLNSTSEALQSNAKKLSACRLYTSVTRSLAT